MNALNEMLAKLPIPLLLILGLLYQGWETYDWFISPKKPLALKRNQITTLNQSKEKAKKDLAEAEAFYKNLDILRGNIIQLNTQLDQAKGMLSSEIDTSQFIKMITLEAKKLGVNIIRMTPEQEVKKDLFSEVPFKLDISGAYLQLLVFFDRIARFQQVIKVNTFSFKPNGELLTKYTELNGSIEILAYKYLNVSTSDTKSGGGR